MLDIHRLDVFAPLPLPTDYRLPITDHRSPITVFPSSLHQWMLDIHRLDVFAPLPLPTDYRLPITDHRSPITDHRLPLFTSSMDVGYSSVGYFRPSSSSHRLPITDHRLPFFTSSMDIGYWIFIGWIFSPPFSAIPIVILFYLKPKTINPYSHILPSKAFDSFSASPTSSYIPSLAVFSRTRPGPTRV